jgi:hypothetical protein
MIVTYTLLFFFHIMGGNSTNVEEGQSWWVIGKVAMLYLYENCIFVNKTDCNKKIVRQTSRNKNVFSRCPF